MSGFLTISEIITNDIFKSTIGAITGLSGACAAIYAVYKIIIKSLNAPIKGKSDFLKSAGVPTWPLRLFIINIPLKTTPINTKTDVVFISGFITFLIGCMIYLGIMLIQTSNTPENWTYLVYKPTGEGFYISHESAKGATVFRHKAWSIKKNACVNGSLGDIPAQDGLSEEMKTFICEVFKDKDTPKNISKSIAKFNHDKLVAYYLISFLNIIFLWLILSLALTMHYKKLLGKYIIEQNEIANSYVT